jgi:predicted MFS family arabinose efflux permease
MISSATQCRVRRARATHPNSGVASGSVGVGLVFDRLGSRRGVMRVCALLYALTWLPRLEHAQWSLAATFAWFLLMGMLIPGFALTWTIAKEVNRPEHSGIATSVVNVGTFLVRGILQPLVGWTLDRRRAGGDAAA